LRKLTAEDLGSYTFHAMTTVGDVDDFRHFLPRIMELLSSSELIVFVDQEVALSKLAYGSWISWPREERNAVQAFLRYLWLQARSEPPDPYPYVAADVGRWLCAIARAEPDLSRYLMTGRRTAPLRLKRTCDVSLKITGRRSSMTSSRMLTGKAL
jgi:hypothetical protein